MENNATLRKAQIGDFDAISTLIASQNKAPETHCIHSDTGANAQSICNELNRLAENDEILMVMSSVEGKLSGVIGCELDVELGRGWLRGPFVVDSLSDWNETASALFKELFVSLPLSIHQWDAFLNIANTKGNNFYLSQGFKQLRLVHVYVCPPPLRPVIMQDYCKALQQEQAQSFVELHNTIFPGTYATGQRILEKLDDQHQVFVCGTKNEIEGYVFAAIDDDTGDGSIEYIGVNEAARGKGLGRQLLESALGWLFEVKKVPQAMLVVNDNLANARSLYESVGFKLKYTGVHNRKSLEK